MKVAIKTGLAALGLKLGSLHFLHGVAARHHVVAVGMFNERSASIT